MGDPDRPALEVLAWLIGHEVAPDGRQLRAAMGERVDPEIFRIQATGADAEKNLAGRARQGLPARAGPAAELTEAKASLRDDFLALALRGRPYFSLAAQVGVYALFGFAELAAELRPSRSTPSAPADLTRVAQTLPGGRPEPLRDPLRSPKASRRRPCRRIRTALIKAAEEAESAGHYDRAIEAFTRLLQQKPQQDEHGDLPRHPRPDPPRKTRLPGRASPISRMPSRWSTTPRCATCSKKRDGASWLPKKKTPAAPAKPPGQ